MRKGEMFGVPRKPGPEEIRGNSVPDRPQSDFRQEKNWRLPTQDPEEILWNKG